MCGPEFFLYAQMHILRFVIFKKLIKHEEKRRRDFVNLAKFIIFMIFRICKN